jgi:hypothetical protein
LAATLRVFIVCEVEAVFVMQDLKWCGDFKRGIPTDAVGDRGEPLSRIEARTAGG